MVWKIKEIYQGQLMAQSSFFTAHVIPLVGSLVGNTFAFSWLGFEFGLDLLAGYYSLNHRTPQNSFLTEYMRYTFAFVWVDYGYEFGLV